MFSPMIARYWFVYGNYDAWNGRYDAPPISVGRCARFYEAGQRAGKRGKFYRRHFLT